MIFTLVNLYSLDNVSAAIVLVAVEGRGAEGGDGVVLYGVGSDGDVAVAASQPRGLQGAGKRALSGCKESKRLQ